MATAGGRSRSSRAAALLGKADGDQREDQQAAEDARDHVPRIAGRDLEGPRAEEDERHRDDGDDRRVDRAEPLLRPVDVLQVRDQANSSMVSPAPIPNTSAQTSSHGVSKNRSRACRHPRMRATPKTT